MYIPAVAFTAIFSVLSIKAEESGQTHKCFSDEEVYVEGEPRKDTFCKPELTLPSQLDELKNCVCKSGYVRNAWGVCITVSECQYCKYHLNQDFSNCHSVCPVTCGEWIRPSCQDNCISGCDCAPGFVRAPGQEKKCLLASHCPPACPVNATFELCQSGCDEVCGQPSPPEECLPSCDGGECVCQQGYAKQYEFGTFGDFVCVPKSECQQDIE